MTRRDRTAEVDRSRAALVIAAMRRTLVTYGELGQAIGLEGIALRNEMRHILDDLSEDCFARGEPSLASLVVSKASGEPGSGWRDGSLTWNKEVRACFDRWAPA
jgi:hypothetical protein